MFLLFFLFPLTIIENKIQVVETQQNKTKKQHNDLLLIQIVQFASLIAIVADKDTEKE